MGDKRLQMAESALVKLTDEELMALQFTMPWQYNSGVSPSVDEDGFSSNNSQIAGEYKDRQAIQIACWNKFYSNPFVNTAIRGQAGRMTGFGFEITSDIQDIDAVIREIETDPRNRLYHFWTKFVVRAGIEGELFLGLTLHEDGFVEVDFIDPTTISGGMYDGVIFHPTKPVFPLFYMVNSYNYYNSISDTDLVPSINIAYYPDLLQVAQQDMQFNRFKTSNSKGGSKYKKLQGYKRFIVSWDKTFITRRNYSHLRTVLEWLNHYENLKKYEIDHKKSSGSYLWVVTITDPKAFRTWVSLSPDDKRKTGIMAKKTPGGTLVLPLGMDIKAINPTLPRISDTDTDILQMVSGGLNEPEDITTGTSKGTFASVKASRGPMSDRVSDEIAYFERFLRYDFYRAVFFLRSQVTAFPTVFKRREAVDFDKKKAKYKNVDRTPIELIDIAFPVSEVIDAESRAKAYLGVKHGSTYDTLGVSNETIAKKMGIGNYRKERLKQASEEEHFPDLMPAVDQETEQDKKIEPGKKKPAKKADSEEE